MPLVGMVQQLAEAPSSSNIQLPQGGGPREPRERERER